MKYWIVILAMPGLLYQVASAAELEAELHWADLTPMSVGVPGQVAAGLVNSGSSVKAGETLLLLKRDDLSVGLTAAAEAQKAATMDLAEALRELERAQELYDRTVLSDHELMKAKIAHQHARARAADADERLAQAQLASQWSRIEAPFAARVLQVQVKAGETLLLNDQLKPQLLVARQDRLWLQAAVSAAQARSLASGQTIKVTLAGKRQNGLIEQLAWQAGKQAGWMLTVSTEGDMTQLAGAKAIIHLP